MDRYIISRIVLLFMLATGSCPFSAHAADNSEEMPIIAYMGIPERETRDVNFQILSECGFTVSLYSYSSLDLLVRACRFASKYGVKVLGQCPEMFSTPVKAAGILKEEKGFFGYFIQDEPSVPEMRRLQKAIDILKRVDNEHCFYINLLPFYHQEWIEGSTKVKTYPEYLKAASAMPCQQLSFDYYPITTSGVRTTWYHNLEMVRNESLSSRKPFWGFVLSVPHDVPYTPDTYYSAPTKASLRLQVYSNLAYGAQAIQYFTYWTPDREAKFNFHDAPISNEGKKTKTYALVKNMNQELKSVSKLFYRAKIISVGHLGVIPQGAVRHATMPLGIHSLKVIGNPGAIITQFEKSRRRYMAIVNKSHEKPMTVRIKATSNMSHHITKNLKEEPIKTKYNVEAGDILLFKLQ